MGRRQQRKRQIMKIQDVVTPRQDVWKVEDFQSDLRSYRVGRRGEEDKLENNPRYLFDITFPSSSLQRIVERVRRKLSGELNQGGFLLIGSFGSGKTHALITLYHLFEDIQRRNEWLARHGIKPWPKRKADAVIISAQEDQPDYLWEPLFERAGRPDLIAQVKDYPIISLLKELVGNRTLAVFVDEIEDWYDGISRDRERLGRNRGFLQNLMSIADEPGYGVFVFISLLDRNPELKALLRRTDPFAEDMVAVGEQQEIIQHRLFESRDEDKAREGMRAYLDAYDEYREQELTEERMTRSYPFHPELLGLLNEVYGQRGQGIRDTLRTLARLVSRNLSQRDLLLASDLELAEFSDIDPELYRACRRDIERCRDEVAGAEALLKTLFFYSLRLDEPGATKDEVVRAIHRPGGNLNEITIPLDELKDFAYHIRTDGRYQLTPGLNTYAIINAEARRIDLRAEVVWKKMDELLREKVFKGRVHLASELPAIDGPELKMVVAPADPSEEELKALFGKLTYANRVILVVPKAFLGDTAIYDYGENAQKARRLVAEENLLSGERRDIAEIEDQLKKALEEDERRLIEELRRAYGRYIRWTAEGRARKHGIEPDVKVIRQRAVVGVDAAYDQILEEVERQDFLEVKLLIDNFYRVQRFPIVEDQRVVEEALTELYRDDEVGFKGLRQTYLHTRSDPFPLFAQEGLSVAKAGRLEAWEAAEAEKPPGEAGIFAVPPTLPGEREERKEVAKEGPGLAPQPETISIVGRMPLELQELSEKDHIEAVVIEVEERELPVDKKRLAEIISGLPKGLAARLKLKVVRGE